MGDEKRHVDHLEETARKAEADLRDDLEKAVEFEKADVAETHREWHDQLHNDHAELVADVARDKEEIREALDDARHPERIVHAAEEKLAHAADEARDVVRAVEHPSVIVDDAKEALAEKKHALDETAATIAAEFTSPADKKRLPVVLRVFGVLLIIGSGVALPVIAKTMYQAVTMFDSGAMSGEGISTIVVTFVNLAVLVALAVTLIVFGVRLIRNQRRWAALLSYGLYVLLLAGALCSIMLAGIGYELIPYGVGFAVTVALQSYLDPSLLEERRAHRKAREAEEHAEGEAGTLGRDPSGKGYITLNFFNLFWIFVVASIIGLVLETIYHFAVVDPGHYQDRAGLLFGPFSPIYGVGAVLMTMALNRFHKAPLAVVFLVSAVIGGLFEFLASWFFQFAFGILAWDYTGSTLFGLCPDPIAILFQGRTSALFMCMWGVLGVAWIKLLLPWMLHLVNLIPWNWRYTLTAVCAALMAADCVMTLLSFDCWYERMAGNVPESAMEQFMARNFDNQYMAERFQSMSLNPEDATRNALR